MDSDTDRRRERLDSDASCISNKPRSHTSNNNHTISPAPSTVTQLNLEDTSDVQSTGAGAAHRPAVEPFVKEAWDRALQEFQGSSSPKSTKVFDAKGVEILSDDGKRRRPSVPVRDASGRLVRSSESMLSARDDGRYALVCAGILVRCVKG